MGSERFFVLPGKIFLEALCIVLGVRPSVPLKSILKQIKLIELDLER